MIKYIKIIIGLFSKLYIQIFIRIIDIKGNKFYLSKFKIDNNNDISIKQSSIKNSIITVKGENNSILTENALISNSSINIKGKNNKLILEDGVKLRYGNIHIRGENCTIGIGKGTTIGGVRIVNVGKGNIVSIGQNCMFSDFIEIWASDTHSILDEKGEVVNKEKPIYIGNNVWIGSHVIILKDVRIEDGAIVGMGTLVTKNIPENTISVGNPNRVIKENVSWQRYYLGI